MPITKSTKTRPLSRPPRATSHQDALEVLTLAEAAAYLRVAEPDVLLMILEQGLPARKVGNDWRLLKAAIQEWLRRPLLSYSKKEFWGNQIGALKDDPYLEELLKEIYRQRGRPESTLEA